MHDLQYPHYSKKKKIHEIKCLLDIYYATYLNNYSYYDIRIILFWW